MSKRKINISLIFQIISVVMVFESLFILAAILISLIYQETITIQLFKSFLAVFGLGVGLNLLTRKQHKVEPTLKESILIVALSWVVLGTFGTFPYLFTHSIPTFTNAFFESISGFTTTGSSILTDIEALPKSILFWRAETHWIGGMGVIVLVVAIMPFLKINGIQLFNSETSNVADEKITTRIKYVARSLWLVYVGLTAIEVVFLLFGHMPLFDSVCHSFATIATGGFSTKNSSIGGYSPYIQYVVTVFMLLSGINFSLHVLLLKGRGSHAIKNEELKMYLAIILFVGFAITFLLFFKMNIGFEEAFRSAFFQVVSILTATGFATANYSNWPEQAIGLIALLMLIGASAGSTGGGVKVIRHLIALKKLKQRFRNMVSPNAIWPIRYNGRPITQNHVARIMAFIITYYLIVIAGTFVMMAFGQSPSTSFGAVATSMAGIGPGFGKVGPADNFFFLPAGAKYFLTFLMILGRLEIYAVIILFTRSFWRD